MRTRLLIAAAVCAGGSLTCVKAAQPEDPAMAIVILDTKFQDYRKGFSDCALRLGNSHSQVMLKPSGHPMLNGRELIRVNQRGAVIRLKIAPNASDTTGDVYRPIGISFERVDNVDPKAVLPNSVDSPFSDITIGSDFIEFRNTPVPGQKTSGQPYRTFKFWVTVQRLRDGAMGIIDPEIENENPP